MTSRLEVPHKLGSGGSDELELERRIVELLTSTRLTFKQIVNRLQAEQLSASIGTIRRINRDNQFRRPRYDSKLSREQRASLLAELMRQCAGGTMRPNLSQLAKQFGVCHGSIWYWWDKLNKTTGGRPRVQHQQAAKRADGQHSRRFHTVRRRRRQRVAHMQIKAAKAAAAAAAGGEQQQTGSANRLRSEQVAASSSSDDSSSGPLQVFEQFHLVGRVEVSSRLGLEELTALPIVMLMRHFHAHHLSSSNEASPQSPSTELLTDVER